VLLHTRVEGKGYLLKNETVELVMKLILLYMNKMMKKSTTFITIFSLKKCYFHYDAKNRTFSVGGSDIRARFCIRFFIMKSTEYSFINWI
jgi:hypothetical protein